MPEGKGTALVTGGAGFIGSHLVERLLERGHAVRVLDNLSSGRRANLSFTEGLPAGQFELVQADLQDGEARRRAVRGADTVFHLAALASVPRSVRDPLESQEVNATGTLALLNDAREAGVRRVVYASSSSVYGESPELPKHEEMTPDPRSPYAISKLTGELYCKIFHDLYATGCVALRYFNVFGPRQDPASEYAAVIPRFITALTRGEAPVIYGDGEQTRDFTYVSDVVDANLLAAAAGEAAVGRVFNIAGGLQISGLQLLEALNRLMGSSIEPRFEEARAGDVRHSVAAAERARSELGWQVEIPLEEGLSRTLASFTGESPHAG